MFQKKIILASLALGSLTLCSAAIAGDKSQVNVADQKREDVRFECRFRCDDVQKKGDQDKRKCEAEGKLDPRKLRDNEWILGDRDDFIDIDCERDQMRKGDDKGKDQGQGQDQDKEGILYGRHFDDLFLTADDTTSPLIVVEDVRKLEGEHKAKIVIWSEHKKKKLEGECRFERKDDLAAGASLY